MKEFQGGLQLLTQGTADIILDCCDDFWSGKDLRPLKEDERKRAQDFYQRNALVIEISRLNDEADNKIIFLV